MSSRESFPAIPSLGLCELPGIGRSTAGAIRQYRLRPARHDPGRKCESGCWPDYRAVVGWPGKTAVHDQLWRIADEYTPTVRCPDYTQAMMDLGATVCTRSRPRCDACPLNTDCAARNSGRQGDYPGRKPRKALPVKSTRFLMIRNQDGDMWLEKRPSSGIWGGLWCFPEAPGLAPGDWCLDRTGTEPAEVKSWPIFRHTFSHYHLEIEPLLVQLNNRPERVMDANRQLWYNVRQPPQIGLATPVVVLLELAIDPPWVSELE